MVRIRKTHPVESCRSPGVGEVVDDGGFGGCGVIVHEKSRGWLFVEQLWVEVWVGWMCVLSGYSFAYIGKYVSMKVRLQGVRLSVRYQVVRL
jgi:hypothetical protein